MAKSRSTRSKQTAGDGDRPAAPSATKRPSTRKRQELPFRARVRMYRHGLGDCFLLSFPRRGDDPFQILVDCGALARSAAEMRG